MKFDNAVAIVTGGASGLGLATAQALLDTGWRVVVIDLPGQADAVQRLGPRATFAPADVTDEHDVQEAVDVAAGLGAIRALVTCAGIAPGARVVGRSGAHSLALFEQTVRVNLVGTFNALRLAAVRMAQNEPIDGERGVIVMTSSVAAFDGQLGQAAYSASKGAVAAMTLPIARELAAHSIRVVSIAPGTFETPMMAALSLEVRASLGRQVPFPARLGRPVEFAALVQHILENTYLNGETIRLDGAIRMGIQ